LVKLFEEADQGWSGHLEVVEPGWSGGPVDSSVTIEGEQDASAVTAEHDASGVIGDADGTVLGDVVEYLSRCVHEVSVVDIR
jgi:hypothetical protein